VPKRSKSALGDLVKRKKGCPKGQPFFRFQ